MERVQPYVLHVLQTEQHPSSENERQALLTTGQQFQQRASPKQQSSHQMPKIEESLSKQRPRECRNRNRTAPFLHRQEEYASSLEQLIAEAGNRSVSCLPAQATGLMAIAPVNPSMITTNKLMIFTIIVDCSLLYPLLSKIVGIRAVSQILSVHCRNVLHRVRVKEL